MGNRNVSGSHSQPLLQQLTEPTSKPELKSCTLAESSRYIAEIETFRSSHLWQCSDQLP
jgi:hypothetical protein